GREETSISRWKQISIKEILRSSHNLDKLWKYYEMKMETGRYSSGTEIENSPERTEDTVGRCEKDRPTKKIKYNSISSSSIEDFNSLSTSQSSGRSTERMEIENKMKNREMKKPKKNNRSMFFQ
ncbi:hypothetical protein SNEBB_002764, partial [Seison nebaliae]